MQSDWQVVLAGEGGQGLIVGGIILAKAAILDGKNAVQGQSYGIQTRGGYSQAEVVLSPGEIYFPKCDQPDLVLALTQDAYNRYYQKVKPECLIVYDSKEVTPQREGKLVPYPFAETALDLGSAKVINILALGLIARHLPAVSREAMEKAIQEQLPPKIHQLNLHAFAVGLGAA